MKTASTKKALLMSVLSLLVCFTMLIGTTFAWFTDSVTSANNKIIAGNLKIDLELLDKATGNWNSIKESKAPLFSEDSLWEPGYTEVKILKVENEGSLALKWKATFSSDVALSDLADVLDVYVKVGQSSYPERADLAGWTKAGTVREFVEGIESTTYGTLTAKGTAGAEAYLGLAVKMREEAGNHYQNMSIGAFDITILATQLASEEDSFDELYDEFADYDGEISNAASLQAAFDQGGTYKLIEDIDLDEPVEVGEGVNVKLDLSGNNILPADNGYAIYNENGGTLIIGETAVSGSITGVILTGAASTTIVNGGTYNAAEGGKFVFLNYRGTLIVNSATINGGTDYALYSYDKDNKLIVNDATVTAPFGCVNSYGDGDVEINGGTFTVTGAKGKTHHCVYAGTSADIVINGGTFAHNGAGISDSGATITAYAGANGGITINGGSFAGSGTYIKAFDKYDRNCYFIINGGTFTNNPSAYVADGYKVITNADGSYSVVSENTFNTTEDVQDALDNAQSGDIVVLAPGNYDTINVSGDGVVIKGSANTVVEHINLNAADNTVIEGITFDAAAAVEYKGYYTNITDNSWVGSEAASGVTIRKCTFTGTAADVSKYIPIYFNGQGRANNAMKDLTIEECKFFVNAFNFIRLDYLEEGDVYITGNTFGGEAYTTGHHAINMSGNKSDVILTGNTFINWKTNKTAFATGRHGNDLTYHPVFTITGNTFSNTVVPGDGDDGVIEIKTNSYNTTNCTVNFSGNIFEGALAGLDETTVKHVKP